MIKWDLDKHNKLKELVASELSRDEIAKYFNSTKHVIEIQCKKIGIKLKTKYKIRQWNEQEISELKQYLFELKPISDIALLMGRCRGSIEAKISQLGLINNNIIHKIWKQNEIETLKKLLNEGKNYVEIGLCLNRKPVAVKQKRIQLKLHYKNQKMGPKRYKHCGEISGTKFSKIKHGATMRGLDFDISEQYIWDLFLKQNRKCAVSGVELQFGDDFAIKTTASLDRIDSCKGYIQENVQWVHKIVNTMKWSLPQNEFLKWIEIISEFQSNFIKSFS